MMRVYMTASVCEDRLVCLSSHNGVQMRLPLSHALLVCPALQVKQQYSACGHEHAGVCMQKDNLL